MTLESPPANVIVFDTVSVFPLATASVPAEKINLPLPSSSVTSAAISADVSMSVEARPPTPVAQTSWRVVPLYWRY